MRDSLGSKGYIAATAKEQGRPMHVLMLEFNELTPSLMDRFIAEGHLPNFARLRDASLVAITDAEESPPRLEPWIQWVTVHTGLTYAEHGCFKLNDGGALQAPRIWDRVGAEGGSSWVCGSMNAGFDPNTFKGHFLPDPWATDAPDHPEDYFKPFTDIVRKYVQEHSGQPRVSPMAMARFGRFMLSNGLNAQTLTATATQLFGELKSSTKWRRALILDRLQWDLFQGIYRREKPQFASFFLNSTAHFQHFHWREMEPDIFAIKPREDDRVNYGDAILQGYIGMDRVVGQALAIAGHHTAIVLCSALSQQPMLTHEDRGGRQIFRHRDIDALLAFAGVDVPCQYAPVMSQEFMLHCENDEALASVAQKLSALRLQDGHPVMWAVALDGKINAGCRIDEHPGEVLVKSPFTNQVLSFGELFYPLESIRSGMHHPEGLFWIKAPGVQPEVRDAKVPLTKVFPTLANLLELESTDHTGSIVADKMHRNLREMLA